MLNFFKKRKEDNDMTKDEEMVAKAKEDTEAKGEDSQSEQSRENESFAEQAKDAGDENSQTAEERIKESEDTEKADKESAEENAPKWAGKMLEMLETLTKALVKQEEEQKHEPERDAGLPVDDPGRSAGERVRPAYLDQYKG